VLADDLHQIANSIFAYNEILGNMTTWLSHLILIVDILNAFYTISLN